MGYRLRENAERVSKRASSKNMKIGKTLGRNTQARGKKRREEKKKITLGAENIAKPVKICTAAEVQLLNSKRVIVVRCKANSVDPLEDTTVWVASHMTVELVDGLWRVHVESVTFFKCCESSTSIVSVSVSHLNRQ